MLHLWLAAIMVPLRAHAQFISLMGDDTPCKQQFIDGDITSECIVQYIGYLIKQIFAFSGGIFFIVLLVGGFQYTIGPLIGGEEKGLGTIRWGIIGMIVSGFSFFIIDFVVSAIAGL
jgi:hypothetical protein